MPGHFCSLQANLAGPQIIFVPAYRVFPCPVRFAASTGIRRLLRERRMILCVSREFHGTNSRRRETLPNLVRICRARSLLNAQRCKKSLRLPKVRRLPSPMGVAFITGAPIIRVTHHLPHCIHAPPQRPQGRKPRKDHPVEPVRSTYLPIIDQ